jgi:hypothetical protein
MLQPGFWLDRVPNPDAPLLTPDQITAFNARAYTMLDIPPVLDLPDEVSAEQVCEWIGNYQPSQTTVYNQKGEAYLPDHFSHLIEKLTRKLPTTFTTQFGLALRRTAVRAFPISEIVTRKPYDFAFDRIQETTIDVGSPVAAVATSLDQHWLFCLTPLYWGWVRMEDIAFGPRDLITGWARLEPFVVTTASRGLLMHEEGITPQMGTRLPWIGEQRILVPVKSKSEGLTFLEGRLSTSADDFARGYLPCTLCSLLAQAFKLLLEPYAWGDSRLGIFGRDCSRLVRDVYATTGIIWPRNANQQEQVGKHRATFTPEMDDATRRRLIAEQVPPGALLIMPGHVMLYLGHIDGEPFAIHATSSGPYSHVIVSDLSLGQEVSLLQRLTHAVESF